VDALIAKHVNLVVANGFDMTPAVNQSATQHPNQLYAIVDGDPPAMNKSNVIVLKWQEHLGSAVIGALSVAMTHSNKIAFLGAVPFSVLYKFWNGYRAGALWASQYLNKNVTVLKQWAGTTFDYFDKPAAGVQIGQSFISSGADVIFTAAGGTGLGTFNAIGAYDQQQGWGWQLNTPPPVFGIGVDANQDYYGTCQFFYKHQNSTSFSGYTAPSFVLTSEVKKVDLGVFDAIKTVVYNNFSNIYQHPDVYAATFYNGQTKVCGADGSQPCHAKGVWLFGLASGSVGVTPFLYTSQYLTPTAKNVVNQITNGILNGTINIPEDYIHDTPP
jgi:basic membrane protein A